MGVRKLATLAVVALSFVLADGAFAASRKKRDITAKMRGIDLVGMQIIDVKEDANAFLYKLKVKEDIEDVEELLSEELGPNQELLSRIFELDQKSAFKNVYVFVAVERTRQGKSPKFYLYTSFQNKNGGIFSVDYDVVKINDDYLEVVNGPSDSLTKYRVETGKPLFGHGPY